MSLCACFTSSVLGQPRVTVDLVHKHSYYANRDYEAASLPVQCSAQHLDVVVELCVQDLALQQVQVWSSHSDVQETHSTHADHDTLVRHVVRHTFHFEVAVIQGLQKSRNFGSMVHKRSSTFEERIGPV